MVPILVLAGLLVPLLMALVLRLVTLGRRTTRLHMEVIRLLTMIRHWLLDRGMVFSMSPPVLSAVPLIPLVLPSLKCSCAV